MPDTIYVVVEIIQNSTVNAISTSTTSFTHLQDAQAYVEQQKEAILQEIHDDHESVVQQDTEPNNKFFGVITDAKNSYNLIIQESDFYA